MEGLAETADVVGCGEMVAVEVCLGEAGEIVDEELDALEAVERGLLELGWEGVCPGLAEGHGWDCWAERHFGLCIGMFGLGRIETGVLCRW